METARAAGRTFVDAPVQTSDKDLRAGGAESWVGDARLFDHGDYCCTRARALKTMSSPAVEAALLSCSRARARLSVSKKSETIRVD